MASGVLISTEAYASLEDIVQLLPKRAYSATTKPSASQCEQMIKDVAKVIDARLRALGYTTPLTDSEDIQVLKHINALGAAVLIESATLGVVQGESPIIGIYQEEYKSLLKDLSDGVFEFNGAGTPSEADADGPDDLDEQGDRSDPVFRNSDTQRRTQF